MPYFDCRMKQIAILGSTGSIGRQTLQVVQSFPERFQSRRAGRRNQSRRTGCPDRLGTARNWSRWPTPLAPISCAERLRDAAHAPLPDIQWGRRRAAQRRHASGRFHRRFRRGGRGRSGSDLRRCARGQAGRAIEQGSPGGRRRIRDGRRPGACGVELLPVDSEHNAIHQCLRAGQPARGAPLDSDGLGRTFPQDSRWRRWPRPLPNRPWRIRTGAWARASRLILRRWSTRASR